MGAISRAASEAQPHGDTGSTGTLSPDTLGELVSVCADLSAALERLRLGAMVLQSALDELRTLTLEYSRLSADLDQSDSAR